MRATGSGGRVVQRSRIRRIVRPRGSKILVHTGMRKMTRQPIRVDPSRDSSARMVSRVARVSRKMGGGRSPTQMVVLVTSRPAWARTRCSPGAVKGSRSSNAVSKETGPGMLSTGCVTE